MMDLVVAEAELRLRTDDWGHGPQTPAAGLAAPSTSGRTLPMEVL
jgi:hypothetical protein